MIRVFFFLRRPANSIKNALESAKWRKTRARRLKKVLERLKFDQFNHKNAPRARKDAIQVSNEKNERKTKSGNYG